MMRLWKRCFYTINRLLRWCSVTLNVKYKMLPMPCIKAALA
ncbi:Uncharacterised protein [Vibrio cholerae]|nr:Uncharacterised protein [Vibrio cholerae]